MSDGVELDDEEAAFDLGTKVLDMADRIKTMDAVMPGTQATYSFEMDGVVYRLAMTVTSRAE